MPLYLQRRAMLLSLPALMRPSPAATEPVRTGAFRFVPLPHERVALHAAGQDGAIVLPVARARILAALPLAGHDGAIAAFAADTADARIDLFAAVIWDGNGARIAALDVLQRHCDSGAHLTTRIAASGGGGGLQLQRDAAAPRRRLAWRRESWTDYLAWHGTAFADAPPRAPLPGTWQHTLAAWRLAVLARLNEDCRDLSGPLASLCQPPELNAVGD